MLSTLAVSAVVFDEAIYPRAEWSQATVNRYAEALNAGDEFPAIVLETDTNRLLDGMHRLQAHKQALKDEIAVVWQTIPDGIPAKAYAASLSVRHGDRVKGEELCSIARETAERDPDYPMAKLAALWGVTRKTVSKWVGDILERRRLDLKLQALLLSRAGWSQARIAKEIAKGQATVSEWLSEMGSNSFPIDEESLRRAASGLPVDVAIDVDGVLEELRQERIFSVWSDEERDLLKRLRGGETIVVSLRIHNDLVAWADAAGLYVRIDRKSEWGNPFELPADGDRDTVIANYRDHYLPYKPSLLSKVHGLRGMALGCWCAPESCHGDVLRERSES